MANVKRQATHPARRPIGILEATSRGCHDTIFNDQSSAPPGPPPTNLPPSSSERPDAMFSGTLDEQMLIHGDTKCTLQSAILAAGYRIDQATLQSWRSGLKVPTSANSFVVLGLIEQRYGLTTGCLKAMLPRRHRSIMGHVPSYVSKSERKSIAWHLPDDFGDRPAQEREEILTWVRTRVLAAETDYRSYHRKATRDSFAIRFPARSRTSSVGFAPAAMLNIHHPPFRRSAPCEVLAAEMSQLLDFKTSTLTPTGYNRLSAWAEDTAQQKVHHLGLMFGALCASSNGSLNGLGLPIAQLSFSLLLVPAIWDWYIEWRRRRRGFYTIWEVQMMRLGMSLVNAPGGWIYQTPGLAHALKADGRLVSEGDVRGVKSDWNGACARLRAHLTLRCRDLQRVIRVHRDPFEPILPILEARSPVAEYAKIANEILRLMPDHSRYPLAAAESVRSFLMIRLGLHLGLRAKNLRQLLVCPRNQAPRSERQLCEAKRGELRWNTQERSWEVFIPHVAFKNSQSSFFSGSPFRLSLPDLDNLYAMLETYIQRSRSVLLRGVSDKGVLFVKTVKRSCTTPFYDTASFCAAWRLIIQRYGIYNPFTERGVIVGLLPHGPHNVRDVLATHILKTTGSFEQASYAIQDTPAVTAHYYGRFIAQDKSAIAARILNAAWDPKG